MAPLGSALWRNFRIYQVFGANTDVGKTIFSTLLCRAARKARQTDNVWYLKPVSTGPLADADKGHLGRYAQGVSTQCFYQFDAAVSPHIAAQSQQVPDSEVLGKLSRQIKLNAEHGPGFMLVETAGGPHSPAPSGTSQAELFRSFRLPLIFIADYRLGGISTSLSAYESLRLRGYDVEGVAVFEDDKYQNYEYFRKYFKGENIPLMTVPPPPEATQIDDHAAMNNYYSDIESKVDRTSPSIADFSNMLVARHNQRIERLDSMASTAYKHIWWPFTQHQHIKPSTLNTIDSAHGDYFQTYANTISGQSSAASDNSPSLLRSTVDGSASWWTQGLGHANTALTAAAANAAGRYGHVMFASGVHEPALSLAERLLLLLENPRLNRVFYSDNGSTAMEVAVKMALKASATRYGWKEEDGDIEMLGLKNSYHGDTIGAMDMSEPSPFNKKVPWYTGRGHWLDFPTVKMRRGTWVVETPSSLQSELGSNTQFDSLSSIFDTSRDSSEQATRYENYIRSEIERLTQHEKRKFGALVLEPIVLGAGGMLLADPLFQRTLIKVVRRSASLFSLSHTPHAGPSNPSAWTGLPTVTDEVFAGLYRLGHKTASSLLQIHPDITVHAKLLTGGLLPLAVTIASEPVFEAALSSSKVDALLHGHSYTAHPVGCAVANESLKQLTKLDTEGAWDAYKNDWAQKGRSMGSELMSALRDVVKNAAPGTADTSAAAATIPQVWSTWSSGFVAALSHAPTIDSVWALGTVLSIEFRDESGAGYTSDAAAEVQRRLMEDVGGEGWNVHSRVLGNVLYLMTSQVSGVEDVRMWEGRLREVLKI